jgi:hypothetical protein
MKSLSVFHFILLLGPILVLVLIVLGIIENARKARRERNETERITGDATRMKHSTSGRSVTAAPKQGIKLTTEQPVRIKTPKGPQS